MKYEYKKGKFIKNGHTMFEEDVLKDLERLDYLEGEYKNKKLYTEKQMDNAYDKGLSDGRRIDLTGSLIEVL